MSRWPIGPSLKPLTRLAGASRRFCLKAACASSAALLLASAAVYAQQESAGPTTEITNGGDVSSNPGGLSGDFFRNDPALAIKYREFFRDTRSPFRPSGQAEIDSPLTGSFQTEAGYEGDLGEIGADIRINERVPLGGTEYVGTSMDMMFMRLSYGLSASHGFNLLGRGFEPQDADLKVGPLYFKLRAISGSVLMSDNVNASEHDREAGAISIARMAGSIVAQLGESLRLRASGNLYWLPFKGKVGISTDSGFYNFDLASVGGNAPVAQIDWEGRIGGWDVFVVDSFFANLSGELFENYIYQESLFDGAAFDEFDRAGRYSYGGYGSGAGRDRPFSSQGQTTDYDLTSYRNRLDVGAQRLLPGPVRLRLHAQREDLWYNQGSRGLPTIRESASIFARYERENLRFKPYVRYDISRTDIQPEWDQTMLAGLSGPITDQLFLNTYVGRFIEGTNGQSQSLAGLSLRHIAGPYTYESFFIGREVDDSDARTQLIDRITYNIHQVLGPKLFADAFTSYQTARAVDDSGDERQEFLAGVRLTLSPGPRTSVRLSYTYDRLTSGNSDFLFSGEDRFDDSDNTGDSTYIEQTLRLGLTYRFTETLFGRFTYEYRDVKSNTENNSYYENLVILTLTKTLY